MSLVYLLDNKDSFTYNLVDELAQLGTQDRRAVLGAEIGDIVERRGLYVDNPGQGRLVVIEQAGSAGCAKMALAVFGRSIDRGRAALHFQRILGKRHPRYHQRTGAPAAILAVANRVVHHLAFDGVAHRATMTSAVRHDRLSRILDP